MENFNSPIGESPSKYFNLLTHRSDLSSQMSVTHNRNVFIPSPPKIVIRSDFRGSSSFILPVRTNSLPFNERRLSNTSRASVQSRKAYQNEDGRSSNSQSTALDTYIRSTKYDKEYWVIRNKVYEDLELDISRHPSYEIKNIAYYQQCEMLYRKAREKYEAQLFREMQNFISIKPTSERFFTKSLLSYSTLWPPLHTKKELDIFIKTFFQLTPKQKNRLNYLLTND